MKVLALLVIAVLFTSCAGVGGFNSAVKTNQLRPGMTTSEVSDLLGQPASSQFSNGYMVWKYSLQKPFVGWIPYYLAFDGQAMLLRGWQENMSEYYASQSLWLQSMPKQYNVRVDGNMNYNIKGNIQHEVNVR